MDGADRDGADRAVGVIAGLGIPTATLQLLTIGAPEQCWWDRCADPNLRQYFCKGWTERPLHCPA